MFELFVIDEQETSMLVRLDEMKSARYVGLLWL